MVHPERKSPRKPVQTGRKADALRVIFFLLVFLLTHLPFVGLQATLFGQVKAKYPQIEEKIRQFRFVEAQKLILALPDPAVQQLLLTRIGFLQNITTDDPAYEEPFYQSCKTALEIIQSIDTSNPLKRVYLAEIYCQRGAVRYAKKKYLACLNDLRKACDLISANQKRFPENLDQLKLIGSLNLVLSAVPRKYQWISNLLFFKGDRATGIKQLEKIEKEGNFLAEEASVVLFYFEKNFLGEQESALKRMQKLASKDADCFLYRLLLATAWFDMGKNEEALRILSQGERFKSDKRVFYSPIWDYQTGKAFYFKQDYLRAITYFNSFLTEFKGSVYQGDARLRIAISHELRGERKATIAMAQSIINQDRSSFDADDYAYGMAERLIAQPLTETEKELFRARNLFDGGYFGLSMSLLQPMVSRQGLSIEEKTELYYRLGRNYDRTQKWTEARRFYQLAAAQKADFNRWMKVYALFYLGKIEENAGNLSAAASNYELALAEDDYFFQAGLERKCKSALNLVKEKAKNPHPEK